MKTIVFAASKGGVGKTTLCAALSSYASTVSKKKIAIIDLDPQGSLTAWWNHREAGSPELIEANAGNLAETLQRAEASGYDYVFIDTPPGHMQTIEAGIKCADYVLVPCQPSPVDIAAIGDTLQVIEDQGKPFAFVMNRNYAFYSTGQTDEQTAAVLASATGPLGSCSEYLFKTHDGLLARNIRDRHLESLVGRVTELQGKTER